MTIKSKAMKNKIKTKGSPKEPPDCTFDEAMRKILRTPKEVVEAAIEAEKKKDIKRPR